ncbi:unnamed protein product [Medioppia subpectinata]|uniref:Uncharacterized protein n=1 Tax=Medioppia subpectinata TaxID=1979941 RepID=A0A7R9QMC0_9ACAR|nr:unnamed protein product [Medioppia subpectinata]CAG2122511.1 unnamed protein product [Medioppia subpectinata]
MYEIYAHLVTEIRQKIRILPESLSLPSDGCIWRFESKLLEDCDQEVDEINTI